MRGRPIEEYANTLTAISRVREWLDECNKHAHSKAQKAALPSRVIDTTVDVDGSFVKLHETNGREEDTKYLTLSYCWGKSPHFLTTKATLEERKRQITVQDLPQTYQDAILLTRELGIRYLWIDSVCICQGDTGDWERESALMRSIYSNAYMTVSADRAANGSEGFLGSRPRRYYVELDYIRRNIRGSAMAFNLPLREEAVHEDMVGLRDEPLSKRAWCVISKSYRSGIVC